MSTIINATTTNGVVIQPDNSGIVQLQSNNTATVTVDTAGNVGIGATDMSVTGKNAKLAVVGNINLDDDNFIAFGGGTSRPTFSGNKASNYMYWSISGTERMRIDSSGNVLIGRAGGLSSGKVQTYAPNSIYTHQIYQDYSSGTGNFIEFIRTTGTFGSVAGVVGTITASTTTTTYATSSDYRLKENIVPMTGALDVVSALKPVTYNWKVDGLKGQGFIAHELQAVVPDCVTGEKDAVETYTDEEGNEQTRIKPQGIDTSFLVATLTAAIQEMKAIIDAQSARITALENK
jgi:hypothetical protein